MTCDQAQKRMGRLPPREFFESIKSDPIYDHVIGCGFCQMYSLGIILEGVCRKLTKSRSGNRRKIDRRRKY